MSAASSPPPQQRRNNKLRVLCLHSWRTSGAIFKAQFDRARLTPHLERHLDLVFVDAPNPALGRAPADVRGAFAGPHYEWFTTVGAEEDYKDFELTYEGLDASEAYLARVAREHGPFDGLIGFSQGAVMASVLAAMQRGGAGPLAGAPPLKFVLLFGAALSQHPRHLAAFEKFENGRAPVPTLHVIGHRDYVKRHSITVVAQFAEPVVLFHNRGHVIPRLEGPHLAVLEGFVRAIAEGAESSGGSGGGGGLRGVAVPAPQLSRL